MNNNDTPPPPLNEMMSMLLKQLQIQQEQSNKIIDLINKQQEQQQDQQEQSNKIIDLINKQQEQQQEQQQESNKIIDLINKQQEQQQEQQQDQQEQSNKIIGLINKQQQDQQEQSKKIIDLINKQQSTHNLLEQCLISISDSAWNKISRKFNLFETVYDFPLTTKDNKDNTNIFVWDDRNEISRMGDCVTYLKNNIKLPKSHSIHDVHSKQNFLTRTVGDVSFRGTTDVGIFSSTDPHSSSLLISFEIKKGEPGSNDHNQSRAQLLTANSSSRFPVLSVLTDLGKSWSFKWLAKPNLTTTEIAVTSCQSAQNAFEIINLFFNKDSMKIFQNNLIFTKTAIPTKFVILHSAVDVGNLDDLEGCLPDEEVQNTYIQAAIMSYYS
ncbi:hypothetical protein ACTFIY_003425 [Dictyostelium cf. discoideum]